LAGSYDQKPFFLIFTLSLLFNFNCNLWGHVSGIISVCNRQETTSVSLSNNAPFGGLTENVSNDLGWCNIAVIGAIFFIHVDGWHGIFDNKIIVGGS
jgi:hypothetical protein